MVQNRFHYAITGKTAPEIVYTTADHTKEYMGLQTWKNSPDGRILLSDTKVAKNYLQEKEIRQLERAVTGYFDYIEDLIERENAFTMVQFAASVNRRNCTSDCQSMTSSMCISPTAVLRIRGRMSSRNITSQAPM